MTKKRPYKTHVFPGHSMTHGSLILLVGYQNTFDMFSRIHASVYIYTPLENKHDMTPECAVLFPSKLRVPTYIFLDL